jgi:hypothetical protein
MVRPCSRRSPKWRRHRWPSGAALIAFGQLPQRTLTDSGASRSRWCSTCVRLRRMNSGEIDACSDDDDDGDDAAHAARGGRREGRPPLRAGALSPSGAHSAPLELGSVSRAAHALASEPLANSTDPAMLAALCDAHAAAAPPAAVASDDPAVQVTAVCLRRVLKSLQQELLLWSERLNVRAHTCRRGR